MNDSEVDMVSCVADNQQVFLLSFGLPYVKCFRTQQGTLHQPMVGQFTNSLKPLVTPPTTDSLQRFPSRDRPRSPAMSTAGPGGAQGGDAQALRTSWHSQQLEMTVVVLVGRYVKVGRWVGR